MRNLTMLLVLLSAFAVSCAHTRIVKKQPGKGGEIMIQEGIWGDARADAQKQMKSNCGKKKPVITEEGEAVVGSTSTSNKEKSKYGSSTTTDSEDKREWRIKYKCK